MNIAIVMLACSDYEAMEISLACHAAYLPDQAHLFILQNCAGSFDEARCLALARRYARLYPRRVTLVDDIPPGPPYRSIATLLGSARLDAYELICKVDDDCFPIAPGWLQTMLTVWDEARSGPPVAYVTPLINNNNWGFAETLRVMRLEHVFFDDIAREHLVGAGDAAHPFELVPATRIFAGSNGTIWSYPYIARWLHNVTTLKPDAFIAETRGLPPVDIPNNERYSINCILFLKCNWARIDDGGSDDEHMWESFCRASGYRIICARSVPFIHIAYFTQQDENRDLIDRIRETYEPRLGHPFPVRLVSAPMRDLADRLRWMEARMMSSPDNIGHSDTLAEPDMHDAEGKTETGGSGTTVAVDVERDETMDEPRTEAAAIPVETPVEDSSVMTIDEAMVETKTFPIGPRRIAFLTFEFPPTSGGGLSTYMIQTLAMHRSAGDQAFVLVIDNGVNGRRFEKYEGHDVIRVNIVNHPICRTLGYWAAASYVLAETLKDAIGLFGKPDIVEVCDGFGLGYYLLQRKAVLEAPFHGLTVAVTAHTPISLLDEWDGKSWYALPQFWTREAEIFCLKAADIVLAPSEFIIHALRHEFECADLAIQLVRNPYEVAAAPAKPSLIALPEPQMADVDDSPYYVFGSRLAVWKGALDVVRAFDLYWTGGGLARLKMFGSDSKNPASGGSIDAFLRRKYAAHIEAGRLIISGLVTSEQLAREKAGARALLHPSHKENFPYTVIEHMGAGGIVIASDNGGQAELIEAGVSGLLFPPRDIAALLAAVQSCDVMGEAERATMGNEAIERVSRFCGFQSVIGQKNAALAQVKTLYKEKFPFIRGREVEFDTLIRTPASPRLSVVVPYFNLPDYVAETVQSALASTFTDLEVIVVDDGSTDARSPAVLSTLAALPRVRVVRQDNAGVAAARNFGVAQARGEFIALLDADDVMVPTYYARSIAILDRYRNVGFVGCWNDDFDENGTIRFWPTFNPEPPMQLIFNTTNCQGLVVRRAAYLAAGGHDPGLNMFLDDWEATISMLAQGIRGVMIPDPLFRYRIRPGSVFRATADRWMTNYEYIVAKHPDFYKEYAVEIIGFLNANGSNQLYHNPTWPAAVPGGAADPFAQGRLARLVRGFYMFQRDSAAGRALRRVLGVFSPVLDALLAFSFRLRRQING